jgi:hypothetical protein
MGCNPFKNDGKNYVKEIMMMMVGVAVVAAA